MFTAKEVASGNDLSAVSRNNLYRVKNLKQPISDWHYIIYLLNYFQY